MKIITGKTGTNHIASDDDRALHAGTFGSGSYVLNTGTQLQAVVESTNTIKIGSGDLVHNGTHARIPYGTTEDANIENGTTGYKRKDLICARYEKKGGIESMSIVVIKGTPATSNPEVPEHIEGNILEGASVSDMPLYCVELEGVNIKSVTSVYHAIVYELKEFDAVYEKIAEKVSELNTLINKKANATSVYTKEEVDSKVSTLNAAISTKANATDVYKKSEIDAKVTDINQNVNTDISAVSKEVSDTRSDLMTEINKKVNASDFDNLSRAVQNKAEQSVVDSLSVSVGKKAEKSELDEIAKRVAALEGK